MTSVSSEQSALLQVPSQGSDGLIALTGQPPMIDFQIIVVVPGLAVAVPHLHKTHASFDQPPGDENLPGLRARAVQLANVMWFALMSKASVASNCMR